jgi:hypothetical protein
MLRDEFSLLCRYVLWGCGMRGLPRDLDEIVTPAWTREYLRDPGTGPSDSSRYRATFHRLGLVASPSAGWPPLTRQKGQRQRPEGSRFDPCSLDERLAQLRFADRYGTAKARRTGISLVALTGGAGLRGSEFQWVQAMDVWRENRHLLVQVGDPHPRTVAVMPEFAESLERLVEPLEPTDWLHDRNPYTYDNVSHFTAALRRDFGSEAKRIDSKRLRWGWLFDLIDRDISARDLYRAAGGVNAQTLTLALQRVRDSPDHLFYSRIAGGPPQEDI